MFWIFANNIYNALAPNNAALGTTLANGWRNFHKINLLTYGCSSHSQTSDYTGRLTIRPYFLSIAFWFTRQSGEGDLLR